MELLARILLCLVLVSADLGAQVIISPTVVLLGDNARIGSVSVRNMSATPQEVSVAFRFGYPQSDGAGNLSVKYGDTVMAEKHSMTAWLSAFPRQFVLAPGSEQVVRLLARPPAGLAEGAYWTRVAVTSEPQASSADSAKTVTARVNIRLEQVYTVIYRRGVPTSGITLGEITTAPDARGGHLLVPIERAGSSPFLGNLTVRVRDTASTVVATVVVPISVYFKSVYRVQLPSEAWRTGVTYNVDLIVTPGHGDIPAARLPRADPVTARLTYRPG